MSKHKNNSIFLLYNFNLLKVVIPFRQLFFKSLWFLDKISFYMLLKSETACHNNTRTLKLSNLKYIGKDIQSDYYYDYFVKRWIFRIRHYCGL